MPQLEFRWNSWLRVFKAPPPPPKPSGGSDAALTAWCAEAARSLSMHELARKVEVTWNARMQTTAGRAWWPDRRIELNPKLKTCAPDEMWRTLKHELAHLVAYERNTRRHIDPHGPEWQGACRELGIPNELPFHTLPFKRRRLARKYAYICSNCFTVVRRVRPLKKAVACYPCCRKFNEGEYHDRFRLIKTAQ